MKPHVFKDEDGDLNVEWISKNYRFGLILCFDPENSAWWWVARDGASGCGKLPDELSELVCNNRACMECGLRTR